MALVTRRLVVETVAMFSVPVPVALVNNRLVEETKLLAPVMIRLPVPVAEAKFKALETLR